jgi:hypothetical protein
MRLLLCIVLVLFLSLCEVQAQAPASCTAPCTKSQLLNDVQTLFPDNTVGAITPSILRAFQTNLLNSSMPTAPTGSGAFACYSGTTGLLGNCTSPLGISLGGTGAITQQGAAAAVFPAPARPGDIAYWTGTAWATVQGNNTGIQVLTESPAGVPSWTPGAFPSAVRIGDIVYWSGTGWVSLPGNNSGTQALTESPTGVPAWATYTNGTVTSVTAGTGLSGGTITTAGTISLNIPFLTASLGADALLNNTANYFDGPSVSQGTAGTWWANGTVTLTDTAVAVFFCKLWDGTTVISSAMTTSPTAASSLSLSLSGAISSPAANIRISCRDITNTTGKILFNATGNSKDSTISVARIQ